MDNSSFEKFEVNFEKVEVPVTYREIQNGKDLAFTNKTYYDKADGNVDVPADSIFDQGTIISLEFPKGVPSNLYDVRTTIDYKASALRLFKNGDFIYDDYYNGDAWTFSSKHLFPKYKTDISLEFKIIPLQPKDNINIGGQYWPDLKHKENVLKINSIEAKPVYMTNFL